MTWSKQTRLRHATTRAQRHANADDLAKSARLIARFALETSALEDAHVVQLLHHAIWKLTEAEHPKYHLPTRTRRAHERILKGGNLQKELRHEHVYPRAEVVRRTLALRERSSVTEALKFLVDHAEACVVLKREATALDAAPGFGWKRYKKLDVYRFRDGELRLLRPRK